MEELALTSQELDILGTSCPDTSSNERAQLVSLVRRWAGATTDAVLDPASKFFSLPDIDGVIGYRLQTRCAIVYGDPVCAPENQPKLVKAFHDYAQNQRFSIIYVAVSEVFAKWATQNVCGASIEFGEELILDPHSDPREKSGTRASLLRRKVRRAQKEGALVKEYTSYDTALEQNIEKVGKLWLESREGPQIHISHVHLFEDRNGKRWFYAEHNGQMVGVVLLNRLESKNGWLLNHLMITPNAPQGTSELLLTSTLEILKKEGCHFVTFGVVSSPELGKVLGLNKFSTFIARIAFKIAGKIFHLSGLNKFWEKFHPESKRSYILFSRKGIGLHELFSLRKALH